MCISDMELTAHRAGDGLRAGLADAAHGHTHVFTFDDDDRPARVEVLHQGLHDLRGEALLHLRPAGVDIHQPCQLAEAGHLAVM
ncbi:hypothetical protein PJL18_03702 [Paenarthrobacter nicotinovorans]|nr:hypothetical protein [Paenarthrobacter nicotinovorans]